MPKQCVQCNETAPDQCLRNLCGRCCEPPCSPNVHKKFRRVMRGNAGKKARARSIQAWKQANKRFREVCKQPRCSQLSEALGITKKELRRALLDDLIEEARVRRGALPELPSDSQVDDDNVALGAALLTRVQVREDIIEDLLESGDPAAFEPTQDFGASSEFRPDWAVESGSDVEQDDRSDAEKHGSIGSGSASSVCATSAVKGKGLPMTLLPMASGAFLPGLTMATSDTATVATREAAESAAATTEFGSQAGASVVEAGEDASRAARSQEHTEAAQSSSGLGVSSAAQPPICVGQSAKPYIVYNNSGKPCAHWERRAPPIAWNYADMVRLEYQCSGPSGSIPNISDVVEWLRDHGVAENLHAPQLTAYEWRAPDAISAPSVLHSDGRWFRFAFRTPKPEPLAGTDVSNPLRWVHSGGDYRRCIHSTNFYVLPHVLRHGLRAGENPGKGGVCGVYCYEMSGEALAAKSSNYCIYTSPQGDGTLWGPRLELQVALGLASLHGRSISMGAKQFAAFEGSYSVTALWVHLITEDELRRAAESPVSLWYGVDRWRPEYVMPI